jgi:hypothetical protein
MSNDRFQEFQSKYPNLFKEYPRSGFHAPDGWVELLHTLCSLVEDHITRLPDEIRSHVQCAQVKEKFGTLRFYMTETTPYINGAIEMAEMMSGDICETCGEKGKRRGGGYILTQCNKCHEAREAKRKEEEKKWANEEEEDELDD